MPSLSSRRASRAFLLVVAVTALVASAPGTAQAAELAANDVVLVREGVVIPDDLYAAGLSIRISGEVHGDLIASSAGDLIIDGLVTGSVSGFAGTVIINGTVEGSVRVLANRVTVNGTIERDLVSSAFTTRLEPTSHIGGEVVVWGFRMSALGNVEGDITGSQRFLSLAGHVGGSVVMSTNRLTVVDDLTVDGSLSYRSGREAQGLEKADVAGTVTRRTPLPPNIRIRALALFARGMVALFLTIAAVTVVWGWPVRTRAAVDQVGVKPWKNWLVGAGIFLSPLVLAAAAGLMMSLAPAAAALPLLAVLVPVIVAILGALLAVALVAGIPVAARFGAWVFKRLGSFGAVLAGSAIIGLLWMLPLVGIFIPLLVLPLGLGAWILSRRTGEVEPQTG